jgi:hypothetical protein
LNQNKRPGEEKIDKGNKVMEERETEIAKGRINMRTVNLKSLYSVPCMPVLFITPP